jgi:regulator of protease activity HflC (stomatin/prohibitin superfamily)
MANAKAQHELAFSASYLTGRDLVPLAAEGRPFEERALAAAVTDFRGGIAEQVIPMLLEMRERDDTMADLFFTAILEECPDEDELEEKLSDLAMQRLQGLPSFQRWAARTSERIEAQLRAKFEAEAAEAQVQAAKQAAEAQARAAKEAAEAQVQAAKQAAEAQARAAKETAEARAREVVQDLQTYFTAKGDVPTLSALETMNACADLTTARYWLNRAYAGETSAEIFPDGNDRK